MNRQTSTNGRGSGFDYAHPDTLTLTSLGILSASIISFQLALMQVLSVVQWYHFAFMVISMALLGFGAAGTVLALFRQQLLKHINFLLPVLMISSGIAMALVTDISQLSYIRFDSYLLFANYTHIGKLLLSYLLFFIPFLFGALAIGLIFDHYVAAIAKIYFANLVGSAAGGLLILLLIWFLTPGRLPAFISCLPVIAGVLIIENSKLKIKIVLSLFAFIGFTIFGWKIAFPTQLHLSQYKDISKTLLLPEAEIKIEKTSPYGIIQAVKSPALRYAPGLSLVANLSVIPSPAVFVNGDWVGVVTGYKEPDTTFILNYTTFDLPYALAERKKVLVLQAGTGIEVAHALSHRVAHIVAIEPNTVLIKALKHELVLDNDSLFYQTSVKVQTTEPRNFLFSDTAHYDLISLPQIGSFGGSAGLYAMHEQFLLTKEAFLKMWPRLGQEGAISVTAWMDYPARNPLKLLATLVEVLEQLNVRHPHHHIAAIRSWGTISFVLTKSPLTEVDIRNIRDFCDRWQFDPAILPELLPGEKTHFHQLQDSSFFKNIDKLLSADRNELYSDYDFNIIPAIDNSPYFSQFIRWKSLPRLAEYFGNRSIPFFEIGYLLVILTLVQITLVSFVLILLPLFRKGWKGNKVGVSLYFGGIGIGYMFVEIVFIQHFILYFGQPVYAAAGVITALLLFSGLGSLVSGYFIKRHWVVFVAIIALLFTYSFLLMPVLQQTVQASLPIKFLIVFILTAPLAFCMGIPFPSGLSQLAQTHPHQIPWAWGLNGCASVISTALVTLITVEAGFSVVLVLAAGAYCLPMFVWGKWK